MPDSLRDARVRSIDFSALDAAVELCAELSFDFLERLVGEASVVGAEQAAQGLVAAELERLGFEVTNLAVPPQITSDPAAGLAQTSYQGRHNVLGRLGGGEPGLLFNGHIDVVPAGPGGWSGSPFVPHRRDGWLVGRGAGDMKGGFAMVTLAIEALRRSLPAALETPIAFLSVIEEECTGNGTLAALRQGITGRAVILPEPTDLGLLLAGVGVLWVDVVLAGAGGHAEASHDLLTPLAAMSEVLGALAQMSTRLATEHADDSLSGIAHPYNINTGMVQAGDWRSSVASELRLGVRVGHPRSWSALRALEEVRSTVGAAVDASEGSGLKVSVTPVGFRAEGYALRADHSLVDAIADCHEMAHGQRPARYGLGSTTDARYYLNQAGVPALCYGPVARGIHGVDEAVNLASIVAGAKTLGRVIERWSSVGLGLDATALVAAT